MPIIRVTKAQIEQANEARAIALKKDPEYRLFEDRQEHWRQTAAQRKEPISDASKAIHVAGRNEPDFQPCNESRGVEEKSVARDMEREP